MEEGSKALTGKLQPWLDRLRSAQPLVHCITNYVTVNDVASLLLACGASPVMADAEEEAAEMATIAGACASLQPAPTKRVFPLRSTRWARVQPASTPARPLTLPCVVHLQFEFTVYIVQTKKHLAVKKCDSCGYTIKG